MVTHVFQAYRDECVEALNAVKLDDVLKVSEVLFAARETGRSIFIVGNGGSAATASHMATDLMFGSQLTDPPLRVIALTDNQAIITATGNDLNYSQVFARQLSALARQGDVIIAVSASGNSPNILSCIDTAKKLKMITIGFTGFDGGRLAKIVDFPVHVATRNGAYGPVEDAHLAINHMIVEWLREQAINQETIT